MTREITRPSNPVSCKEAEEFGGPYWDFWKHSLLDYLGEDEFPDKETENLLHNWWCLRMRLKLGIIDKQEFDKNRELLFPAVEDDPLLDHNSFLSRAVRYITHKTAPSNKGDRNW